MKRPVIPDKRVWRAVTIVLLLMFSVVMFDWGPAWLVWVWYGMIVAAMAYMANVSFEQECRAYGWRTLAVIPVLGVAVWLIYRLRIATETGVTPSWIPEHNGPAPESFWQIPGVAFGVVVLAAQVVFDLVCLWFIFQPKRYPEESKRMHKAFRISLGIFALLSLVAAALLIFC